MIYCPGKPCRRAARPDAYSCINATNEELKSDKRDLAFADIETLQEDYRLQFIEGFFFVHGLPLPGFAWGLILEGSSTDWVAYELEDGEDSSEHFPPVYVPSEVVEALSECGVAWGGLWESEFPVMERPQPTPTPLPEWQRLPDNPLLEGGTSLLPPTLGDN